MLSTSFLLRFDKGSTGKLGRVLTSLLRGVLTGGQLGGCLAFETLCRNRRLEIICVKVFERCLKV